MKNIERLKEKYLNFFAQKYHKKFPQELSGDSLFKCSMMAEVRAYIDLYVPQPHLNIFDFDGRVPDYDGRMKQVIPDDVVIEARDKVCEYCWGKKWSELHSHFKGDPDKIQKYMRYHSVMAKRLEEGNSLVIFGESSDKIGRTLVASIALSEAIKLRIRPGQRGQNYEWVDFPRLKNEIRNDTDEAASLRSCNWLIVDNIIRPHYASREQQSYVVELIDSFFIDRVESMLPTILVFKFDIREHTFNVEEDMGVGISKIVQSDKTFLVPLSRAKRYD
jgi:hypothetical protein